MSLVKFINDSEPYLSAENLNNNFEYLESKINETNKIKLVSDFITPNDSTVTIANQFIYNQGSHYWGYVVINKTSVFSSGGGAVLKMSKSIMTDSSINSCCYLVNSAWGGQAGLGYLYIGGNIIQVGDPNNTGYKNAKIYIDIVTDD